MPGVCLNALRSLVNTATSLCTVAFVSYKHTQRPGYSTMSARSGDQPELEPGDDAPATIDADVTEEMERAEGECAAEYQEQDEEDKEGDKPLKRKKYAIWVAYVGAGYHVSSSGSTAGAACACAWQRVQQRGGWRTPLVTPTHHACHAASTGHAAQPGLSFDRRGAGACSCERWGNSKAHGGQLR